MVYDGCASHYNDKIVKKTVDIKVIFFILPDNATHLIQSLYIAVFKPFMLVLRKYVTDFMLENAITTISKKLATTIGSKYWREGIEFKTKNDDYGFRAAGMWPLFFSAMQRRLKLFKDGGIADSEENPTWMRCRETVRTEVLSIPPEIDRPPKRRQKIYVNDRLLSREQLNQIDP